MRARGGFLIPGREVGGVAKPDGNIENLDIIRTKEEARKRGANGGRKSGEARRKKRDARNAIRLILDMAAQGRLEDNLKALGVEDNDLTNMVALQASVFTRAIAGDMNAYRLLMEYGGYNPDKKLKDEEHKARIKAIERDIAVNSPSGTGEMDDVVVYLPDNGRDGAAGDNPYDDSGDIFGPSTDTGMGAEGEGDG